MSKKVKVTKVEIEIGDSKQMLTLDQAKELRDVLNDAFPEKYGQPITYPIVIHEWPRPYYHWTPTWIQPTYTTCTGDTLSMAPSTSNVLSISANTEGAACGQL